MDDIIEIAIEVVGEVLETTLMHIKDPKKRKWALRIFYSFWAVALAAFMTWLMVDAYRDGNVTGAVVVAAITVLMIVLFGILIVRRRKKNK